MGEGRGMTEQAIVRAVLYAMRSGCLMSVPPPKPPYRRRDLIRWGAMRNLHQQVADYTKARGGRVGG